MRNDNHLICSPDALDADARARAPTGNDSKRFMSSEKLLFLGSLAALVCPSPSFCLCVCLFVCLSVCLSVSVSPAVSRAPLDENARNVKHLAIS